MDHLKARKAEKIATENLSDETLSVIAEMLDIIVGRTHVENPEQSSDRREGVTHRLYPHGQRAEVLWRWSSV